MSPIMLSNPTRKATAIIRQPISVVTMPSSKAKFVSAITTTEMSASVAPKTATTSS
ncbi:hypothetical protein D1872_305420 [compost metagenome]